MLACDCKRKCQVGSCFCIDNGLNCSEDCSYQGCENMARTIDKDYLSIRTIKLKLSPMINLESICYLNCQWKILVLLSKVSRTGSLGGGTF